MVNVKGICHYSFAPLLCVIKGMRQWGGGGGEAPPEPPARRKAEKQRFPMES